MKNIILITLIGVTILSCEPKQSQECIDLSNANSKVKSNLELYSMVWDKAINGRNIEIVNLDFFDENIKAITADGDIEGIDAFKAYYNNYLTGFSDAEFNIVDVFGQGDKIVKHWNFKGTHDGDFFGIPPTGKKIDLIGTTLVLMKDGKILQEQDFFDNYSLLSQLGLLPTE
ncbi:ester cyclase [Bacteroidota bacterium]|nr:ester cyclase [Bacteroidota bacterium]MEC8599655.1 ester cyclase [Bacteroidota bacterium]